MDRPPRLAGLATASPPHVLPQAAARAALDELFESAHGRGARLLEVFANAQIDERRTCMPLDWYLEDHSFDEKNALYVEHAVALAEQATRGALDRAGLAPAEVDHFVFVSSTGLATPSVDALVAGRMGMRADVRRTPIWGLGCAGGAAGLARAAEFARAEPRARVLLVALELCSLTFQPRDSSKKNCIAASLFADGAAAAVVAGADARANGTRRALAIDASASTLWKDTRDIMGWSVGADGLTVILSRDLPAFVRKEVRPSLLPFLERLGLGLGDVAHMVAHPGGVKVLAAWGESLGLPDAAFRHSRAVLRAHGNMSSPSCLFVLERFVEADEIGPGERALLSALGPGFGVEYVLLRGEAA